MPGKRKRKKLEQRRQRIKKQRNRPKQPRQRLCKWNKEGTVLYELHPTTMKPIRVVQRRELPEQQESSNDANEEKDTEEG